MSKNLDGKLLGEHNISDLIHTATTAFNALSDEEQKIVLDVQRHSWLRGEKALDRKPAAREYEPQDINYYLSRLEGQLARLDFLITSEWNTGANVLPQINDTVQSAKAFLASLRNALDPRRIDVA